MVGHSSQNWLYAQQQQLCCCWAKYLPVHLWKYSVDAGHNRSSSRLPPPQRRRSRSRPRDAALSLVRPNQGLAQHGNHISSSSLRCRLTRRASQTPRHRAAHLAAVARPPSLSRVAPRQPPSLITHVTRASPVQRTTLQVLGGYRRRVTYIMTTESHEYLGGNSVENPWWSAGEKKRKSLA